METHAHHLHKAPASGFKHYLFEFLMLFLAVFCGFLTENWREHLISQRTEKQYIKSFYEDLTADENDLKQIINSLEYQVRTADSLTFLMANITTTQPANHVYMYLREITRSGAVRLEVNDRTIVQLRNAGGMRLISDKNVSDSMLAYYKEVEKLHFLFDESLVIKRALREEYRSLLNAADFSRVIDENNAIINPSATLHLRAADPNVINNCLLEINNIRGLSNGTKKRIEALKERASSIKKFLEREYGVKA